MRRRRPLPAFGESRYTGCPGGAVALSGTGYSLGPGSGETAGLAEGPARHGHRCRAAEPSLQRVSRRVSREDRCAMPRQRTNYRRRTYEFPDDFPQRLVRFQEESGLSWSEIARRIGTYRHTVWRWTEGVARVREGQTSERPHWTHCRSGGSPGKLSRSTICPPQREQWPKRAGAVHVFGSRLSRRPTLASSGRSLATTARLSCLVFSGL